MAGPMAGSKLIDEMCPPLDSTLVEQLVDEFVSLERRYVLGDWEPATLDGGQFAEACARVVYHQDAQTLHRRRGVAKCLKYVEDRDQQRQHHYPDRKSALHACRVLRAIYKFRSDRGAVHIDPVYTANHADSKLVVECARWLLCELLRVFWSGDRSAVAQTVREIVRFEVPAIAEIDGRRLLQRTDCTAEEEVLLLLHHAGESGLSRSALGQSVLKSPSSVTRALVKLTSSSVRQVLKTTGGDYILTDLGVRRVINELAEKLTVA